MRCSHDRPVNPPSLLTSTEHEHECSLVPENQGHGSRCSVPKKEPHHSPRKADAIQYANIMESREIYKNTTGMVGILSVMLKFEYSRHFAWRVCQNAATGMVGTVWELQGLN